MRQTRSIDEIPTISGNKIVGYAALWNVVSPFLPERLAPNCFIWSDVDDVTCCRNHDADNLLGRLSNGSLIITQNAKGLYFECEPAATTIANDTKMLIQAGDLRGCSFTFKEIEGHDEDGVWVITKAKLFELGPVTCPAYPQTSVGTRKRPSETKNYLESLKNLRELDSLYDDDLTNQ